MKLKYAGPKEIVSPHGIDFKRGKDDKYVYIEPAMQIYYAIHHDYQKNTIYSHDIKKDPINDEEILNKILSIRPQLKTICEDEISNLKRDLENEIDDIKNHKEYNSLEQEVYKNNLIIMKNYRLQRETNKILYNHLIEIIVDDIFNNRLKDISTPFNEKYWHVLQSIQGELSNHNKRSIGSSLDTIHKTDSIIISLKINSIGK